MAQAARPHLLTSSAMTHAVASDMRAADVVEGWLAGARDLGPGERTMWRSSAGGYAIDFFCTDRRTAEVAAARLIGPSSDEAPQFRLCLLETERLGWAPPRACEDQRESLALTRALDERGIAAVIPVGVDADSGYPWVVLDKAASLGAVIVRSVDDLPPWMVNAPFSVLLHLAFAWRGRRLLHAASLGLDGRGALIAGPGGVGKSATTISGLLQGLATVGDDYLALDFSDPVTAWPVYRTLKQAPAGLSRLPALRKRTAGAPLNWHGKAEFDAELVRPGCIASQLAIAAILIPEPHDGATTIIEAALPTAAFSALAPSTLFQLPGVSLSGFAQMTRLTRGLPAFRLRLSRDSDEVGASLRRFLEGLPS